MIVGFLSIIFICVVGGFTVWSELEMDRARRSPFETEDERHARKKYEKSIWMLHM